jgi:hypothetical protein
MLAGSETSDPLIVETVNAEVKSVVGNDDAVVAEGPRKRLLARLEGAHPTKLGAVSFTLLHSCWLNSIAAETC